ncbi:hypothetical protein Barb7_01091 [Bacteroidales bacterium Barb7]|nr:hypothetical protein Barb7_01091 [Bacteroidales bacterium Barb7]
MVVIRAIEVFGNVHILHPYLAFFRNTISIHETCLSQADGLYLRTGQHHTGRVRFEQFVIERCPLVLYLYVIAYLLFHFPAR